MHSKFSKGKPQPSFSVT
jgi:isoleucyl-tRNA synthetase